MRRAALVLVAATMVASWAVYPLAVASASIPTSPVARVWTEPQAGYGFLDAAIDAARTSIDVSMYELSDPATERDLIAKAREGLSVRVLLNSDYDGRHENTPAANTL